MLDLQTIDISTDPRQAAAKVVDAARNLGFIYLSNHGISRALIRRVFDVSSRLFQLSTAEKQKYEITPDNRGWSKIGSETLDPGTQKRGDDKEAFNVAPSSRQPLPEVLEDERETLLEFEAACQQLCGTLCKLLAEGLGIESDFFSSKHNARTKAGGTIMRLLYYPAMSTPADAQDGGIRAGAHSDYGSMTLLFQNPGQSGLEVLSPESGLFEAVPPPTPESDDAPIPILVNIADQMTLWTAGQLRSTVHRVTSTYAGDRYSIAYFCHPDDDTVLEPHRALLGGEGRKLAQAKGDSITAGEHLRNRLQATYSY